MLHLVNVGLCSNTFCVSHNQGLQRHPPSPSELDRSHLERGRGCRRGGSTTGRSNLMCFSEDLPVAANLANTALSQHPPDQAATMLSASSPSSSGSCWPPTWRLQRSENEHAGSLSSRCLDVTQLGTVAANGRLRILEEGEKTVKKFWSWTKSISKVLFVFQHVDTRFVKRREFRASAQTFIFVREALTGLYVIKYMSLFRNECEWYDVYSEEQHDAAV